MADSGDDLNEDEVVVPEDDDDEPLLSMNLAGADMSALSTIDPIEPIEPMYGDEEQLAEPLVSMDGHGDVVAEDDDDNGADLVDEDLQHGFLPPTETPMADPAMDIDPAMAAFDGLAIASFALPENLHGHSRLAGVPVNIPNDEAWIVLINSQPCARIALADILQDDAMADEECTRQEFLSPAYFERLASDISHRGLVPTLRAYNASIFAHTAPRDQMVQEAVEAREASLRTASAASLAQAAVRRQRVAALVVAGDAAGFAWDEPTNLLRDALTSRLASYRIPNPHSIADDILRENLTPWFKALGAATDRLSAMSDEALAELEKNVLAKKHSPEVSAQDARFQAQQRIAQDPGQGGVPGPGLPLATYGGQSNTLTNVSQQAGSRLAAVREGRPVNRAPESRARAWSGRRYQK